MRTNSYWIVAGLLAVSAPLWAAPENHAKKSDGRKGYFWYQKGLEKAKEQSKEEKFPKPAMPAHGEMMAMHPQQIRALLDEHREYAIYTMQPDAVLNYYKVQDVARRKAEAFTAVSSMVLMQNPHLNAQSAIPITNPGMAAKRQQRNLNISQLLRTAGKEFALGLFTSPGCQHCQVQKQTLVQFYQRHGWKIKEINVREHMPLAKKFDVYVTPTIILIRNNTTQWMPVSVGVEALTSIEQNVYRAVRLIRGEIQPQQFFMEEQERGGFSDPLAGVKL